MTERCGGRSGGSAPKRENAADEGAGAKQKALALLADMDRTESELYEKLQRAGFSAAAAAEALSYVRRKGYVDDARYAARYIEIYRERRSRRRIEYDLRQKGIDRGVIGDALTDAGFWDEKPLIRELLRKKKGSLNPADPRNRQKLAARAARQGFQIYDILSVLDEICGEEE